jgi:Ca2+-binding RTX toxin-like protein
LDECRLGVNMIDILGSSRGDVLIGTASADLITDPWGEDIIDGGDGNDSIIDEGGSNTFRGGNDVLFGELGADTFVFERGTGGDVIGDFVHGTDRIDLRGLGFSFAQLQTAFSQVGTNGAINLGSGDFIVLHNVTMSSLTASDFVLV